MITFVPAIDVSAEVEISGAPADVAAVMFDAAREPEWIKAVTAVEVIDPALKPGARVRRTGAFLGHDIAWTTEVTTIHFPHVLTMQIADGPFVGTVYFSIQRSPGGSVARIRNAGELKKMGFVPASLISGPLQSALAADLQRLKALVEKT